MFTMILISSTALFVAVVGCALIWGLDARRAEEIDHPAPEGRDPAAPTAREVPAPRTPPPS